MGTTGRPLINNTPFSDSQAQEIIRKQKPAIKRDKNGEAYFTYKIEGTDKNRIFS